MEFPDPVATMPLKTETREIVSAEDHPQLPVPASFDLGLTASLAPGRKIRYLLFLDLLLVWFSAGIAHIASFYFMKAVSGPRLRIPPPAGQMGFIFLFSVLVVLFVDLHGLYARIWQKSFRDEVRYLGESISSAALVLIVALFMIGTTTASIVSFGPTVVWSWATLAAWRSFLHAQSIPGLSEKRNVLITGGGKVAKELKEHLDKHPELGYVVKGFLDRRREGRTDESQSNRPSNDFLGHVNDLPTVVRTHFIDEVFVCVPHDRRLVLDIAEHIRGTRVHLRVIPDLYETAVAAKVEYLGHFPTLTVHQRAIPTLQLVVKRLMDIVLSMIALLLLTPFMLVIAALVSLESKGPALYSSFRVGQKGVSFRCFKFRTMVKDADALKLSLGHLNERDGVLFKISADPRITPIGRFLRKYSLDELPQLLNVFLGQLSLVGPRPHPLDDYSRYALEDRRRLEVKPGVTGLWQVTARRDPSFERNVALDIEYISTWSLWLDLRILWKTVAVVVTGTGQ